MEPPKKQDRDRLILFSFSKKIISLLDSDEDQYLDYLKFCAYYCYVFMKRKCYSEQNNTRCAKFKKYFCGLIV